MIEGLWTTRFLLPEGLQGDLNGGVAVIETGRLLGGDSGYFYIGDIIPDGSRAWTTILTITRHDPSIISLFGDLDHIALSGRVEMKDPDDRGREVMFAVFPMQVGPALYVQMTKVADLP